MSAALRHITPTGLGTDTERYIAARCALYEGAYAEAYALGLRPDAAAEPLPFAVLRACQALFEHGEAIGLETVRRAMKERGTYPGEEKLSQLTTAGHEDRTFADEVRYMMALDAHRRAGRIGQDLCTAMEGPGTSEEKKRTRQDSVRRLLELDTEKTADVATGVDLAADYEAMMASPTQVLRLQTGLWALDEIIRGLHVGRVTILATYTSHGKSLTARHVALNVAMRGQRVVYFDLENSRRDSSILTICNLGSRDKASVHPDRRKRLDARRLLDAAEGRVTLDGWEQARAREAADLLRSLPFTLVSAGGLSSVDVRAMLHVETQRHHDTPPALVVVDYAEIMGERGEGRADIVANACVGLHDVARDFDVPVMLLSQLKRDYMDRTGHEPRITDLAWSQVLEKVPATVIAASNPHEVWAQTGQGYEKPDEKEFNLYVLKNKGRIGNIGLELHKESLCLRDPKEPIQLAPF